MGTGRTFNKAPRTRPKKSGAARTQRDKVQKRRLVEAGYTEEQIKHMTSKDVRANLMAVAKKSS